MTTNGVYFKLTDKERCLIEKKMELLTRISYRCATLSGSSNTVFRKMYAIHYCWSAYSS